jgi:hypothetical protein
MVNPNFSRVADERRDSLPKRTLHSNHVLAA